MKQLYWTLPLMVILASLSGVTAGEPDPTAQPTPAQVDFAPILDEEARTLQHLEEELARLTHQYEQGMRPVQEPAVAQAALQLVAEPGPDATPTLLVRAADLLFEAGNFAEALSLYRWAADRVTAPLDQSWVGFQIGSCLYGLKQYSEATRAYQQVASRFGDTPWGEPAAWCTVVARWKDSWQGRSSHATTPLESAP